MSKLQFKWKYGENKSQKYYEVRIGNDYLCVYANKWNPDIWMGSYNSVCIHNKTKNDRVRKKQGLPIGSPIHELHRDYLLCSDNPEYMMKKVEWCYTHNLMEISQ